MGALHYVLIGFSTVVVAKILKNILAGYGITF
jgi:hypothetical protein